MRMGDDVVEKLRELAEMRRSGSLDEGEFEAAKAAILGPPAPAARAEPASSRRSHRVVALLLGGLLLVVLIAFLASREPGPGAEAVDGPAGLLPGGSDGSVDGPLREAAIGTWTCVDSRSPQRTSRAIIEDGTFVFVEHIDQPEDQPYTGTWQIRDGQIFVSVAGESDEPESPATMTGFGDPRDPSGATMSIGELFGSPPQSTTVYFSDGRLTFVYGGEPMACAKGD
jgi:hypothetical protein